MRGAAPGDGGLHTVCQEYCLPSLLMECPRLRKLLRMVNFPSVVKYCSKFNDLNVTCYPESLELLQKPIRCLSDQLSMMD